MILSEEAVSPSLLSTHWLLCFELPQPLLVYKDCVVGSQH